MDLHSQDLSSVVATALEESPVGGEARFDLKSRRTEVQVRRLLEAEVFSGQPREETRQFYPFVSDRQSARGIALPIDWNPKVTYRLTPSTEGGLLEVKAPRETVGTARLRLSPGRVGSPDTKELSFPTRPYRRLEQAWSRVVAVSEASSNEEALSALPTVREIAGGAKAQQDRYRERAERLLSVAREALLGWIVVTLENACPRGIPPREGYGWFLRPRRRLDRPVEPEGDLRSVEISDKSEALRNLTRGDLENESAGDKLEVPQNVRQDGKEKQRRAVSEKWGRPALFAMEVSKLWEMLCDRSLTDPQLQEIARGFGVPDAVNEATTHVIDFVLTSLEEVDQQILTSQALAAAGRAIEAKIVETGELPTEEDLPVKGIAHQHTVDIGKALKKRREGYDGNLPSFSGKERFKDWAGDQIGRTGSTAYEALDATGCWVVKRQGKTKGLGETVENAIEYSERHG